VGHDIVSNRLREKVAGAASPWSRTDHKRPVKKGKNTRGNAAIHTGSATLRYSDF
jgi:hypothetical protein